MASHLSQRAGHRKPSLEYTMEAFGDTPPSSMTPLTSTPTQTRFPSKATLSPSWEEGKKRFVQKCFREDMKEAGKIEAQLTHWQHKYAGLERTTKSCELLTKKANSQYRNDEGKKSVVGKLFSILSYVRKIGNIFKEGAPESFGVAWAAISMLIKVGEEDINQCELVATTSEKIVRIMITLRLYEESCRSPSGIDGSAGDQGTERLIIDEDIPNAIALVYEFCWHAVTYLNKTKLVRAFKEHFAPKMKPTVDALMESYAAIRKTNQDAFQKRVEDVMNHLLNTLIQSTGQAQEFYVQTREQIQESQRQIEEQMEEFRKQTQEQIEEFRNTLNDNYILILTEMQSIREQNEEKTKQEEKQKNLEKIRKSFESRINELRPNGYHQQNLDVNLETLSYLDHDDGWANLSQFIFESEDYKKWEGARSVKDVSLICLTGRRGYGKTIKMTTAIKRLRIKAIAKGADTSHQSNVNPSCLTLWFYFQSGHDETQRALRAMQSIVAQLLNHPVFTENPTLMKQTMDIIDNCSGITKASEGPSTVSKTEATGGGTKVEASKVDGIKETTKIDGIFGGFADIADLDMDRTTDLETIEELTEELAAEPTVKPIAESFVESETPADIMESGAPKADHKAETSESADNDTSLEGDVKTEAPKADDKKEIPKADGKADTARPDAKAEALKSCESLTTVIMQVASLLNSLLIFIVIDAIDECADHEEKKLVQNLKRLADSPSGTIRVLMSARDTVNIDYFLKSADGEKPTQSTKGTETPNNFEDDNRREVASTEAGTVDLPPYIRKFEINEETNKEDLNLFLQYKVDKLVARRRKTDKQDQDIRKSMPFQREVAKIVSSIKAKAKGDFAFATLVVASLEEPSRFPLEKRLEKLPDKVTGMYMKSLKLLSEDQRALVIMALTRIVWGFSKISVVEIAEQYKYVYHESWYGMDKTPHGGSVGTQEPVVAPGLPGNESSETTAETNDYIAAIEAEIGAEIEDTIYHLRRSGRDFFLFERSDDNKDHHSVVDVHASVRDWVLEEANKALKLQTESRPLNSLFRIDEMNQLTINIPIMALVGADSNIERLPSAREAHLDILIYLLKTLSQPRFQRLHMPWDPPKVEDPASLNENDNKDIENTDGDESKAGTLADLVDYDGIKGNSENNCNKVEVRDSEDTAQDDATGAVSSVEGLQNHENEPGENDKAETGRDINDHQEDMIKQSDDAMNAGTPESAKNPPNPPQDPDRNHNGVVTAEQGPTNSIVAGQIEDNSEELSSDLTAEDVSEILDPTISGGERTASVDSGIGLGSPVNGVFVSLEEEMEKIFETPHKNTKTAPKPGSTSDTNIDTNGDGDQETGSAQVERDSAEGGKGEEKSDRDVESEKSENVPKKQKEAAGESENLDDTGNEVANGLKSQDKEQLDDGANEADGENEADAASERGSETHTEATFAYQCPSDASSESDGEDQSDIATTDTHLAIGKGYRYEVVHWMSHMKELEKYWLWTNSDEERKGPKWDELKAAISDFIEAKTFSRWRIQYWQFAKDRYLKDSLYGKPKYLFTPLHLAAKSGFITLVKHVVEHGNGLEMLNLTHRGKAPLHKCGRYPEITEYLLSKNADVDQKTHPDQFKDSYRRNDRALTPLIWNLLKFYPRTFDSDAPSNSLDAATREQYIRSCKLLIKKGADLNVPATDDDSAVKPVHIVPYTFDMELVEMVFSGVSEENLDEGDGFEMTPLHHCFRIRGEGSTEFGTKVAKMLIDRKADVNAQNLDSMAPLRYAVSQVGTSGVRLLLDHGADIYDDDLWGTTALMEISQEEKRLDDAAEVAQMLFEKEDEILVMKEKDKASEERDQETSISTRGSKLLDTTDQNGNTVLGCAVRAKNFKLVKLLLERYEKTHSPEEYRKHLLQKDTLERSLLFKTARHSEGAIDIAELIMSGIEGEHLSDILQTKAGSRGIRRPIHKASVAGNKNMILYILDLCVKIDSAAEAGKGKNLEKVQAISALRIIKACYMKMSSRRGPEWKKPSTRLNRYTSCLLALMERFSELVKSDAELFLHAAITGSRDVWKMFQQIGALPAPPDEHGWTVAHYCASYHTLDLFNKIYPGLHVLEDAVKPLLGPQRWSNKYKHKDLEVSEDGLECYLKKEAVDNNDLYSGAYRIVVNHPIPADSPRFYFEVTFSGIEDIENLNANWLAGIGVVQNETVTSGLPGWLSSREIGIHTDCGNWYSNDGYPFLFNHDFSQSITNLRTGDIVGVGFDLQEQSLFYTKNGEFVGIVGKKLVGRWFPCIAFSYHQTCRVTANFGQSGAPPFRYDRAYGDIPQSNF